MEYFPVAKRVALGLYVEYAYLYSIHVVWYVVKKGVSRDALRGLPIPVSRDSPKPSNRVCLFFLSGDQRNSTERRMFSRLCYPPTRIIHGIVLSLLRLAKSCRDGCINGRYGGGTRITREERKWVARSVRPCLLLVCCSCLDCLLTFPVPCFCLSSLRW